MKEKGFVVVPWTEESYKTSQNNTKHCTTFCKLFYLPKTKLTSNIETINFSGESSNNWQFNKGQKKQVSLKIISNVKSIKLLWHCQLHLINCFSVELKLINNKNKERLSIFKTFLEIIKKFNLFNKLRNLNIFLNNSSSK